MADHHLHALIFEADKAHDAVVGAMDRLRQAIGSGKARAAQRDLKAATQRWELAMVALYAAVGFQRDARL